jgi:hypothetical protein
MFDAAERTAQSTQLEAALAQFQKAVVRKGKSSGWWVGAIAGMTSSLLVYSAV